MRTLFGDGCGQSGAFRGQSQRGPLPGGFLGGGGRHFGNGSAVAKDQKGFPAFDGRHHIRGTVPELCEGDRDHRGISNLYRSIQNDVQIVKGARKKRGFNIQYPTFNSQ